GSTYALAQNRYNSFFHFHNRNPRSIKDTNPAHRTVLMKSLEGLLKNIYLISLQVTSVSFGETLPLKSNLILSNHIYLISVKSSTSMMRCCCLTTGTGIMKYYSWT